MAVTWQLPPRVVGVATNLLLTCALGALLAFSFLGSRGIWDPDEGRYSNVALTMLDTGDWLTPRRNSTIGHWTKPPGTYWLVAGSVALFGETPWAARLPIALSYLACMLLAGLCADRLVPGSGPGAALRPPPHGEGGRLRRRRGEADEGESGGDMKGREHSGPRTEPSAPGADAATPPRDHGANGADPALPTAAPAHIDASGPARTCV